MAVSTLSILSLPEFTDLTRRTFSMMNNLVPERARMMFIEQPIPPQSGNVRRFQEVDGETYASLKNEGADAILAQASVGFSVDMTARRFAKQINITWEMRNQGRDPEIKTKLTNLAAFCPQRTELDLTHILTFADSTSYTDQDGETVTITVGDALALVSASHTLNESSSTYSNVITGNPVFSASALEVAEERANTQILTNFDERRVMNFNAIWTSDDPPTVNAVKQMIDSTSDVDQANPGVINVYGGKYKHIILPYLATNANGGFDSTKANRWGLAAIGQGTDGWEAYLGTWEQPNLKVPSPGNNGEDFESDDWKFGARCTYGIAVLSGKGLLMSTGLGS